MSAYNTQQHRKKIIVTGASSGIGRAISEALLAQDYAVLGIARDFSKFQPDNSHFTAISLDLAALDALPAALLALSKQHPDIHGLICCAGTGRFGSLEEFSFDQIRQLIDINLSSQIFITQTFLPLLKANKAGNIIFIGSEAALQGGKRGAVYSATKFAIRGLAQALRHEASGANVHISIINPGMVRTAFFDQLNFAPGDKADNAILAEDVADTVMTILTMRAGTVIDEINLSPLKKVVQFERDDK